MWSIARDISHQKNLYYYFHYFFRHFVIIYLNIFVTGYVKQESLWIWQLFGGKSPLSVHELNTTGHAVWAPRLMCSGVGLYREFKPSVEDKNCLRNKQIRSSTTQGMQNTVLQSAFSGMVGLRRDPLMAGPHWRRSRRQQTVAVIFCRHQILNSPEWNSTFANVYAYNNDTHVVDDGASSGITVSVTEFSNCSFRPTCNKKAFKAMMIVLLWCRMNYGKRCTSACGTDL